MIGTNRHFKIHGSQSGFTLLELVLSIAIFATMLVVLMAAYGQFVRQQQRHAAEQELQEDMRVVLELFNREARTGFGTTYRKTLLKGNPAVSFINQSENCVVYGLSDEGTILRGEVSRCDLDDYNLGDRFLPLTAESSKVAIDDFEVQVFAARANTDGELVRQGIMSLALAVRVQGRDELVRFQSTVASRQVVPYE